MKEKVRPILFAGIILFISVVNIISPTKVFSRKENRYLEGFPKLTYKTIMSGEFSSNFEKYSTDQFIGRDAWISLKTISDLAMFKKDNNRVYFGKDDYLFDVDEDINKEQFNKNMLSINKFLEKIKEYNENVGITALLVPTKSQVLEEKLPLHAPLMDENHIVEKIKSSLNDNINILNLTDTLKEHSKEDIYYKTDHHWTTKGAYYAYKHYLQQIGDTPLRESEFIKDIASDEFYGTSYRKANFYRGEPDKIYSYIPKEPVKYTVDYNGVSKEEGLYDNSFLDKVDKYSYFLGGDKPLIEIDSEVRNNKTIVIVKDSFANSMIPFLINHYEKIIIIDTRYFNGSISEFIKEKDVDEVLLLYNIQNFAKEKTFSKFGL